MNRSRHDARFTRAKAVFVVGLAFLLTAVQWRSWSYAAIGILLTVGSYAKACEVNVEWRKGWVEALRQFRLKKLTGEE